VNYSQETISPLRITKYIIRGIRHKVKYIQASSVGIMTRLRVARSEKRGLIPGRGKRYICLPQSIQTPDETQQVSHSVRKKALSLEVTPQGREADPSHPSI